MTYGLHISRMLYWLMPLFTHTTYNCPTRALILEQGYHDLRQWRITTSHFKQIYWNWLSGSTKRYGFKQIAVKTQQWWAYWYYEQVFTWYSPQDVARVVNGRRADRRSATVRWLFLKQATLTLPKASDANWYTFVNFSMADDRSTSCELIPRRIRKTFHLDFHLDFTVGARKINDVSRATSLRYQKQYFASMLVNQSAVNDMFTILYLWAFNKHCLYVGMCLFNFLRHHSTLLIYLFVGECEDVMSVYSAPRYYIGKYSYNLWWYLFKLQDATNWNDQVLDSVSGYCIENECRIRTS